MSRTTSAYEFPSIAQGNAVKLGQIHTSDAQLQAMDLAYKLWASGYENVPHSLILAFRKRWGLPL